MRKTIEEIIRAEIHAASKFDWTVIDGDSAPVCAHVDAWRRRKKNRRSKHYHYIRAVNELRVGRGWLVREFPVSLVMARLAGFEANGGIPTWAEQGDVEWRGWLRARAASAAASAAACAEVQARRAADRSFEPESEAGYA